MNTLRGAAIWIHLAILLTIFACGTQTANPPAADSQMILGTPAEISNQATLAFVQTQLKNDANLEAAATAEIERANAQATMNSANATLGAALTQEQSDANFIAAQVAATAEIERANAQATLNAAGITQNAALTQDSIYQTQVADLATTGAQAVLNQQNKNDLAAGTQTAIADLIATQTQAAAATSQWYVNQSRQRSESRQGPITFLLVWCLPLFIVLFAGLLLWGFWRRLRIQPAHAEILDKPVERLQLPTVEVTHFDVTKPDDQVKGWLDEVKNTLISSDKEDEDDHRDD